MKENYWKVAFWWARARYLCGSKKKERKGNGVKKRVSIFVDDLWLNIFLIKCLMKKLLEDKSYFGKLELRICCNQQPFQSFWLKEESSIYFSLECFCLHIFPGLPRLCNQQIFQWGNLRDWKIKNKTFGVWWYNSELLAF